MTTQEQTNPTGLAEDPAALHPRKALLGAVIGWGFVILAILAGVITYVWESRNPRCNNGVLMADMIGIATLSDMVPLTGENRAFAYYGLTVLRKSPRAGLMRLLSELGVDHDF